MPLLTDIKPVADTKADPPAADAKGGADDGKGAAPDAKSGGDDAKVKADIEAALKAPFADAKQLKLPEGFNLDETVVPTLAKLGLTAAQAQALVEYQATTSKAQSEAREAKSIEAAKASIEALRKDPDIGGAKFEASMAIAQKALVKFGGAINPETKRGELVDALDSMQLADGSMLGDSPVLAKFLVNVGNALSEDALGGHLGAPGEKNAGNDEGAFLRGLYKKTPSLKFPGS